MDSPGRFNSRAVTAMLAVFIGATSLALMAPLARAADPKSGGAAASQPASTGGGADGPVELVTDADKIKDLLPLKEHGGQFVLKAGRKPERDITYRMEKSDGGLWVYTLDDDHVSYLKRAEGGGVEMPRETDVSENVDVFYEPAIQVLPPNWTDSPVIDGTASMVVKNAKTGSVRERGTCVYRVELVGKQKVHTPAGDFEAIVIRETRHIRLNLAKSDVTSLTWYVPDRGEVGEHLETVTKALGFIGGKKVEDRRLSK